MLFYVFTTASQYYANVRYLKLWGNDNCFTIQYWFCPCGQLTAHIWHITKNYICSIIILNHSSIAIILKNEDHCIVPDIGLMLFFIYLIILYHYSLIECEYISNYTPQIIYLKFWIALCLVQFLYKNFIYRKKGVQRLLFPTGI